MYSAIGFTLLLTIPIYPQRWAWGRLATLVVVLVGGATAVGHWAPPNHTAAGLGYRAAALVAERLVD